MIREESAKFQMLVKIIDILIENLSKNFITTRRDIYYQDVKLFKDQRNVDSFVSLLCTSLNFKDYEIGAVAAQKGLFLGNINLILNNNDEEIMKSDSFEMLIPKLYNVNKIKVNESVKYLLIIEKEAIFNSICHYSKLNSDRILITGKGFPDQLTKSFVHKIITNNPTLKVFGICDLDPYGINILRQYKNGGIVRTFREEYNHYSCPLLKPLNNSIMDFIDKNDDLKLIDLNNKEFIMIFNYFKRWKELNSNQDNNFNTFIKQELQRMLFFGKKCELNTVKMKENQGLNHHGIFIVKYIDQLCLNELSSNNN